LYDAKLSVCLSVSNNDVFHGYSYYATLTSETLCWKWNRLVVGPTTLCRQFMESHVSF